MSPRWHPQLRPRALRFPWGATESAKPLDEWRSPPSWVGGTKGWGSALPCPAVADLHTLTVTVAQPPDAEPLQATPPAPTPVLRRHAPSCLSTSTPLGDPGGAQICQPASPPSSALRP